MQNIYSYTEHNNQQRLPGENIIEKEQKKKRKRERKGKGGVRDVKWGLWWRIRHSKTVQIEFYFVSRFDLQKFSSLSHTITLAYFFLCHSSLSLSLSLPRKKTILNKTSLSRKVLHCGTQRKHNLGLGVLSNTHLWRRENTRKKGRMGNGKHFRKDLGLFSI